MSSARSWMKAKLAEKGYSTQDLGEHAMRVRRTDLPDATVFCVGLAGQERFGPADLAAAIEAMPSLQFIAVLPARIEHEAYASAEERGICLAGFGELQSALKDDPNVAGHVDTQERFERLRLSQHPAVHHLKRRGHHAYEVHRERLRPLTIVTTNNYEFTADEMYGLAESYSSVQPEVIVVTNPNCHGLSRDSQQAARHVGVDLVLLRDFQDRLGRDWK